MTEARRQRATQWFAELRDRICVAFEKLEDEYAGPRMDTPAGRFDWYPQIGGRSYSISG